jgi:hypothetical protein
MRAAFEVLCVRRLQAVAGGVQELADLLRADAMASRKKFSGELARTLGRPAQRRLRARHGPRGLWCETYPSRVPPPRSPIPGSPHATGSSSDSKDFDDLADSSPRSAAFLRDVERARRQPPRAGPGSTSSRQCISPVTPMPRHTCGTSYSRRRSVVGDAHDPRRRPSQLPASAARIVTAHDDSRRAGSETTMIPARPVRLERTTGGLEGRCSIQLSYGRKTDAARLPHVANPVHGLPCRRV